MSIASKFSLVVFVLLSLIFLSCDSDGPGPAASTVQLLKLTVDANYSTKDIDDWVMVHDKNGVLLGVKKFESGQVVNFETQEVVPDDVISVTLFSFDSAFLSSNGGTINLSTYSDLPKGEEWKLALRSPITLTNCGQFTIDIDGVFTDPFAYVLSSNLVSIESTTYFTGGGVLRGSGSVCDQTTEFMVSMEREVGHPQYLFLNNMASGGNYKFSVDDLKDFDHTLDVFFPATNDVFCDLRTYDPSTGATGYDLYLNLGQDARRDHFRLGYLDQFRNYYLGMYVVVSGKEYAYTKRGAMPKAVNFPFNMDYGIQNTGINEFSLKANPEYSYRESVYQMKHPANPLILVNWTIDSPGVGFKFMTSFPKEITAVYPFLDVNEFDHGFTEFNSGLTYTDFIDLRFRGSGPVEYEQYTTRIVL